MSRLSVPALLTLLAAVPFPAQGQDQPDPAQLKAAAQKLADTAAKAAADAAGAAAAAVEKAAAAEAEAKAAAAGEKPAAKAEEAKQEEAKPAAAPAVKALNLRLIHPLLRARAVQQAEVRVAAAADDDDGEKEEEPQLSDEQKKAVDEFIEKAAKLKRKMFEGQMETAVKELTEEQQLTREARRKLEAGTGKAVDAAMTVWNQAFQKYVAQQVLQGQATPANIKAWSAQAWSNYNLNADIPPPAQSDEWRAVIKEVLNAEQLAAREAAAKAAEEKFQKDFGDYLATCEGQAGDQMSGAIESEVERIARYSNIDEERRKKLKAAGEDAVKECVKAWRRKMENQLKSMDEKQREQMTSRGGMMSVNMAEKEYQPKERQVWQDAVAQLLTDAERQKLESRYLEVRGRRADALAIVLVNDLDRLVGFSAEQRTKMLPLAAQRLLKLPEQYFTSPAGSGYNSIDAGQMLQQVQKLKDDELKTVLSEGQVKRFREASPDQMSRNGIYVREKLDVGDVPKPEEMDEVEVERVLATFLHREAKRMKLKMLSLMEAQVEHIGRVAGPSPETVQVLTTAAKGAAEEMALGNINNLSGWVRAQFQNLKPADVPERLKNLYNPYSSERHQPAPPPLWTTAVERLLDEAQRKAWKEAMDIREQWRREGLTAVVLTEIEKRLAMPEEQRLKLARKVDDVITQYEPDFANYFSQGWHLQGYYSLIPIAMFTDKEMEEHFDAKQREALQDKLLGNSMQYAEMIRQNHKSRTGREK